MPIVCVRCSLGSLSFPALSTAPGRTSQLPSQDIAQREVFPDYDPSLLGQCQGIVFVLYFVHDIVCGCVRAGVRTRVCVFVCGGVVCVGVWVGGCGVCGCVGVWVCVAYVCMGVWCGWVCT